MGISVGAARSRCASQAGGLRRSGHGQNWGPMSAQGFFAHAPRSLGDDPPLLFQEIAHATSNFAKSLYFGGCRPV